MVENACVSLKTVKQFVAENPAFTYGGMRKLINLETINGMKSSGSVVRIGRKVFIDTNKFYNWIQTQNGL
ncbi:MAG: hypothetical protein R8M71_00710 [Alphaproteobacteria bacterium]|nr:hypothetical protein [Alphaproteobacteria bacterium]MDW2995475.1 hypothetical protein [Alphaproteobacteria bacterium]